MNKYNTSLKGCENLPSMRIPMRIASVPVVGYLSFLASNSPMANDFIALLDHLHPLKQYQNLNPNKITEPRRRRNLVEGKILTWAHSQWAKLSPGFCNDKIRSI